MSREVFILGSYQSDFSRCWAREGKDISDLCRVAIEGVLEHSRLDPGAIQSIHVGNAFAELQRGQAHLGAMPASVMPELIGVPAMRHEAACASGSIAVLAAMAEIEAGRYDCVLVLGVEEERNTSGDEASVNMNAAAWIGHEPMPGRFMWPQVFGALSHEYERRYGLAPSLLSRIAKNNYDNARRNPRAQTRQWRFGAESFMDDDAANPQVAPGVRRTQCTQITDGAAAVILASGDFAARHARERALDCAALPRILGWGHRTADLAFLPKLERSRAGGMMFPQVTDAVNDALRRARCADIRALDGIELHDCFATTELLLIEHAGLAAPGQGGCLFDDGEFAIDGRFPVNPSGGLIGGGHPVGATGVRMLADAARQVTHAAGEYQVAGGAAGVRRFGTLNVGGAFGTVCSFVVGTDG
ncbi:MAG TPA: acetyl-CoA acetyltransferase [Stenotrophobium sp.]|jgi:acetyl-CoA C-acetyltransferase|nr:acetyl-CoA acetyltransferase [Stenotrophobium sp.]